MIKNIKLILILLLLSLLLLLKFPAHKVYVLFGLVVIVLISCCKKSDMIENMINIDVGAVKNLSTALTNGRLSVNDLIVTNNLSVGSLGVTGNATIGPAFIGKYGGDTDGYAQFSHKDCKDKTKYAVLQRGDGKTFINCASGNEIDL